MPFCKRRPSSLLSNHMHSILRIVKLGLIDDDFILQNIVVCLGIYSELVTAPCVCGGSCSYLTLTHMVRIRHNYGGEIAKYKESSRVL